MWTIFFIQLFYGVLALLICYSIGKLIASFFDIKGNFFFRLFVTYIIGITAIVLFYSLIKAHGRTVNILLLPIVFFMVYNFRNSLFKRPVFDIKEIIKEMRLSSLPFLLIFGYQCIYYFDFSHGEVKTLFADYYWYAIYCDSLKIWGAESRFTEMNNYFPQFRIGLIPYHYYELWLTTFFSSLFKNSSLNTYYFTMYPIVISTYIIGIISLLENVFKKYYIAILLACSFLFISGITIPFFEINAHNSWGILDIIGQKLAILYCYILLSFILIINKKWVIGLLILSTLPIFSITFIPGIWLGLSAFCVLKIFIDNKYNSYKESIILFITIILFLLMYCYFYIHYKSSFINNSEFKNIFSSGIFKHINGNYSFSNIKIILSNFIVYTIPTILIHIGVRLYLYLVFFVVFYKSSLRNWRLFAVIICILMGGATATSLANGVFNKDQFVEVISSLLTVFFVIVIAHAISMDNIKSKKSKLLFISIFILYIIFTNNAEINRNKAIKYTQKNGSFFQLISRTLVEDTIPILTFESDVTIKKAAIFSVLATENDLMQLLQISNKTIIFSFGNPDIFLKYNSITYSDDSTLYYNLTPLNVWRHRNTSNDLCNFIKRFNIKYFYFKDGATIPSFIAQNTLICIESNLTHNRFIKIK